MNHSSEYELPVLKLHMGNEDARYLSPQAIYSLNRVLYEILDKLNIATPQNGSRKSDTCREPTPAREGIQAWVVPNLFDHHSRTWHFACVLPHVWRKREDKIHINNDEVLLEVLWLLAKIAFRKELRKQFKQAKKNLRIGHDYDAAYEKVKANAIRVAKHVRTCSAGCDKLRGALSGAWTSRYARKEEPPAFENFKKSCVTCVACALGLIDQDGIVRHDEVSALERAVLLVYHGFRLHRSVYIPGILYRGLSKRSADTVIDSFHGAQQTDNFAKVNGHFVTVGGNGSTTIETSYDQFAFELEDGTWADEGEWQNLRGDELSLHLTYPFYFRRMAKKSNGKSTPKRKLVVLPIRDVWLAGIGYGGLWGCLLCTFHEKQYTRFVTKFLPKLRPLCEELSAELAMSALSTVTSLGIAPPYDLIEHFIRVIIYMQDWECVTVYQKKGRNRERLYCYHRFLDNEDFGSKNYMQDFAWGRCQSSPNAPCVDCNRRETERELRRVLKWDRPGCNIWSQEIIPELSLEEIEAFDDILLEFEYSTTATVPQDRGDGDKKLELFELAVIQRQIEVLRSMIPKVRARRAAVRSAVSAIMGRNMSHNIGSHVLARYSSMIKHDLDPTHEDYTDHRTDFLGYLQRRMDYLAEVATSDKAFWEQPLSLNETINKLNFDVQEKRIKKDQDCSATCSQSPATSGNLDCSRQKNPGSNVPILLSYITGKESLTASVVLLGPDGEENPDGGYFSCPGGEVGVQALYVILENIIRNSARHAKSKSGDRDDKQVCVHVLVGDDVSTPGSTTAECNRDKLMKLTIIDPRTELDSDGWVMEDGKRVGKASLTKHIEGILTTPFLDDDGSTNPKYWGLREMQICAHYLRGFSLKDLEGESEPPLVLEAKPWPRMHACAKRYYLSYTLYLKRAQLLAYVETSNGKAGDVREARSESQPRPDDEATRDKQSLSRGIKRIPIFIGERGDVDWRKIADEARGYGFLALPCDLMAKYEEKLNAEASSGSTSADENDSGEQSGQPAAEPMKHALPIRIIKKNPEEVRKLIEKTVDGASLNWMQPLHEAMITNYRKNYRNNDQDNDLVNANRWGKGNIYAVVAWDGRAIANQAGGATNSLHVCHVARTGCGEVRPFQSLPQGLPYGTPPYGHVGLAWLDHPNDPEMTQRIFATPAAASISVGNRSINWASVEPMWSDSPHKKILFNAMQHGESDGMHELAAAAFARVVVLDERIQSRRHDKVRDVTLYKYWPQTGIWCPLHPVDFTNGIVLDANAHHAQRASCNLDEPNFNEIQGFLREPTKLAYQLPVDFLVLHLTILERMNKQQGDESINATLLKLVKDTQCARAQIIIVTGRGVPTIARHRKEDGRIDARYLPISALQEFLVTRPSKLGLMRVLWAAAAPGN